MTDSMPSRSLGLQTVFEQARPTHRHLRRAHLLVVDGPDKGAEAFVTKQKTFIGRTSVNDLTLTDSMASATHAEITVTEDGTLLKDLGSTNGTFFAGTRVREIFLHDGLCFQVGNNTVRFDALEDVIDIPLSAEDRFGQVTGRCVRMREIFAVMERVAPTDLTVLISGETGTGKERLARSIHDCSRRSTGPYVVLDCSSIPKDLAESTVFGHEKGAFTGAVGVHRGVFEQADQGSIFLDEVGELDLALQPKLLRVLENREVKRIGGDRTINVELRVIAATNRDLRAMVADGSFREDLYFRLSIIECTMPPLRERTEDLEVLLNEFLALFSARRPELGPMRLARDAVELLLEHRWPGNVRELKNVMERAVSLADSPLLERSDLRIRESAHPAPVTKPGLDATNQIVKLDRPYKDAKQELIDEFEVQYLKALSQNFEGNLSKAAREVGLTRFHLREMLKRHNLLEAFKG